MTAEATILPLGDSALLIRFADTLSDIANRAAVGAATRISASALPGVVEVVPGLVSVLLRLADGADFWRLSGEVRLLLEATPDGPLVGTIHDMPVAFDGEDIGEVAGLLNLSVQEFVARHNAGPLRVLATGFAPGFVYCGLHPADFAVPRREQVRAMVPAGTVLFAAGQTAIAATPIRTGWHVIGRTSFQNFDPAAEPPTVLRPGDTVRFHGRFMTTITILRAGPLTTLQDHGRPGMLRHGISASGPMDCSAFAASGAALPRVGATGIEFTQGLSIETDGPLTVASTAVHTLAAGDRLDIPAAAGNYGYLRFDLEMAIAPVLGSTSTNVMVGLGGYKGRALKTGDRISFDGPGRPGAALAPPGGEGPIRIVWGIHADLFLNSLRQNFAATPFRISSKLDRMGVRLDDPAGLFREQRRLDLVSDFIVPGDIQILGDGTPIVLMRDHQPTGGYPRIATIVSADLDRFAQMRPGTKVLFTPVRR